MAVVRLSGPNTQGIAGAIAGRLPVPRYAALRTFRDADGAAIDRGLLLYFPAPNSYTGDDTVEFHCHGGPAVVEALLRHLVQVGARGAEPGEFTQRAYLNGRLDLSQAEAVAALIEAETGAAAAAALRSLDGEFGQAVDAVADWVAAVRVELEAGLDFSDEEAVEGLGGGELRGRILGIVEHLEEIHRRAALGVQVGRTGDLTIVGAPNMGKSSLMNALCGRDAAIVHAAAGTTRDVVTEPIRFGGRSVRLVDTAGLRSGEGVGDVEVEGVRRARRAAAGALHVMLAVEDGQRLDEAAESVIRKVGVERMTLVRTKTDLGGGATGLRDSNLSGLTEVAVSAKTGEGLEALIARLEEVVGGASGEDAWAAKERHLAALDRAKAALYRACRAVEGGEEMVAEDLREAQDQLGEITGRVTTEELLGRIFSSFCIGK